MDVVIHAGAHVTDEDRLITTLVANREQLAGCGTNVPDPSSYRKLIRDVMHTAEDGALSDDARDVMVDAIVKGDARDRLVLSNDGFFGTPKMAMSAGNLYAATEKRLQVLHDVFHRDQLHLFMATCNPATYLPAIFQKTNYNDFPSFMRDVDPRVVRWSEMIARLRSAYPDLPMTIWCNEDLPLIWAEVLRALAGVDATMALSGEHRLLREIMTPEGFKRFEAYVASHTGMSDVQKRRVISAFLDKFARDEALEEELDIPGWTEDLIDEMTDLYDEDLGAIEAIEGVRLILP